MALAITGDAKKIKQIKNIALAEGLNIVYQSSKPDLKKENLPNVYSVIFKDSRDPFDYYIVTLGLIPFEDDNAVRPAEFIAKIRGTLGNMTDRNADYSVSTQRLIELLNEQKTIGLNDDADKIDGVVSKLKEAYDKGLDLKKQLKPY
jgi:hypothetical protein